MRRIKYCFSIVCFVMLFACEKATNETTEQEIEAEEETSEEDVSSPEGAVLLFPEQDSECNEGIIVNDTESTVTFRWEVSKNTDTYQIVIESIHDKTISFVESDRNMAEITIDRAKAFQWHVISKSEVSEETAQSEIWKFYNAGEGISNHVPFPADAIYPESETEVTASNSKITLQWSASDVDNDIVNYEIFIDTQNDPRESLGIISDTSIEVEVDSGTIYYWKVWTNDENGNRSRSTVFNFTVK